MQLIQLNRSIKILFFIVFLFVSFNNLQAQKEVNIIQSSQLVIYNLRYVPDSTSRDTSASVQALLLGDGSSIYGVYGNLNHDTANFYSKKRGEGYVSSAKIIPKPTPTIGYRIVKDNENIITYDKVRAAGSPMFRYIESKKEFNWTLKEDTMTISGIFCQRADCVFGNRKWTAWFAPSIPISDGPYKFCGLPGLILEIADEKGDWKFSMASISNVSYSYSVEGAYIFTKGNSFVETSKQEFMKLLKDSYDNGLEVEQQFGVTPMGDKEKIRKSYIDRAKKESNWLELYTSVKSK